MTAPLYRLSEVTVLDVVGADAGAILHNLTTNHVKALDVGESCETFLTDVRGKTLGHVTAVRTEEGYCLVGAGGQAEALATHIDRYTIREDATPEDHSAGSVALVAPPGQDLSVEQAFIVSVDWLGEGTRVFIVPPDQAGAVESMVDRVGDEHEFHAARTAVGFPWFGVDLSDKNLPQEANRIERSICFTKGCYLGQETVARLDALGQVQKQLMRWETEGGIPEPGSEVKVDVKTVGRLTSVTPTSDSSAIAIGMARRSHFDAGATAQGEGFTARVL